MENKYLQVLISAENQNQAIKILDALLAKKLITGGPILQGPAKFWWKEKIVEMNYAYIFTYTIVDKKEAVIDEVKRASAEEVPMISFILFEGNRELLNYIDSILK